MKMEYGLSGCQSIVLHDIQAVAVKCILHRAGNLLSQHNQLLQRILVNLIDIGIMLLRQNQGMTLRGRIQVQNYPEQIIS